MKQADLGLNLSNKRTRKREFLDQMDKVVPWAELVELVAPHCPQRGRRGRQPYEVGVLLRIHFLQQWKKRCTKCRCTGSFPGCKAGSSRCPTRA